MKECAPPVAAPAAEDLRKVGARAEVVLGGRRQAARLNVREAAAEVVQLDGEERRAEEQRRQADGDEAQGDGEERPAKVATWACQTKPSLEGGAGFSRLLDTARAAPAVGGEQ